MIEVDAAPEATRARRRTWLTGGVLITLSAMIALGGSDLRELMPGLPFDISQALFHAGAVVLAVGFGAAGSVTARRALGTGAIIALAVWQLGTPLVMLPVPTDEVGHDSFVATLQMIDTMIVVVALALAIIAVAQIGRIGVVPKPWNWAPLWALCVVVGVQVLLEVSTIAGSIDDQTVLLSMFGVASMLRMIAIAALGVLAIVLAVRPAPGGTVVYSSGA